MFIRFGILLLIGGILAPLRGQDAPVKMTPEFCFTFPLAKNGKDVTVKFPVLVNATTILKPGMILRTLYILSSYNANGSSNLVLAHKGNMEQSYARSTLSSDDQSKMPPELAHEIEGYRRTVWDVPNNFVMAMAQYPTDAMHLIYSPNTGKSQDLDDERFNFFDGLLIGLPDGKVTVLAVENESKADKVGIKAGDEIIAVGGNSTQNDLATFVTAYTAAKKTAKDNEVSSFPITLRSEGKSETRTVNIALTSRIKSGLMDGF